MTTTRDLALRTLLRVGVPGSTLADELAQPRIAGLAPRERAFLHELILGTLRQRGSLDHSLQTLVDRPLPQLVPPALLAILRLGAYQILYTRVPDHAAVGESVDLARRRAPRATGLVNAVLRRLAREGAAPSPDPDRSPLEWLTTTGSLPRWLAVRWLASLGAQKACARAAALAQLPPTAVRLNPRRLADARALLERHPGVRPSAIPDCWIASAGMSLGEERGTVVYAQDEGSQMVAHLVARPGAVLDLCAAPGGKATLIADIIERSGGVVVACERSPRRLRTMAGLVRRWGCPNVRCVGADALRPPFAGQFESVLLDAPCSGLGTLGRHPDVRWRAREDGLAGHANRQREMLRAASRLVRPGGTLVYSVCSLEPEETTQIIDPFLADHPQFRSSPPPAWATPFATSTAFWRLPERDGGDGFFAVSLAHLAG